MKHGFDSIAQRSLYGYLFTFADAPADPAQAQLHGRMKALWEALYANPALLGLPVDADEAYEWFKVNNTNPELNEKYLKVFKGIFQFWQLFYVLARFGRMQDDALYLSKEDLKVRKAAWQAGAVEPLAKADFELVRSKSGVSLRAEEDLLISLQALAKAAEENAFKADGGDKFRLPCRTLFDFARCSFDGEWSYLIRRVDEAYGYDGLLTELEAECLARGYRPYLFTDFGQTGFGFGLELLRGPGGFRIGYNPRKYWQFCFATKNGIGEKKMLENFASLSPAMQKHFISSCRPCTGCMSCTKGGKAKMFTIHATYEGAEYALCPQFPRHEWEHFDRERMELLFEYHELQEKYG